jgi:hypothetical protein
MTNPIPDPRQRSHEELATALHEIASAIRALARRAERDAALARAIDDSVADVYNAAAAVIVAIETHNEAPSLELGEHAITASGDAKTLRDLLREIRAANRAELEDVSS